jgi:hypothetical protein
MLHIATTHSIPPPALPNLPVPSRFLSRAQLLIRASPLPVGRDLPQSTLVLFRQRLCTKPAGETPRAQSRRMHRSSKPSVETCGD